MSSAISKSSLQLVLPSILSFWFCFIVALSFVSVLVAGTLSKNELYKDYVASLDQPSGPLYENYKQANEQVNSSKLAADVSVFIVWSLTGLFVYYIAVLVLSAFTGVYRFIDHLGYSHSDEERAMLWHETLLGLFIRSLVVIAFIVLIQACIYLLVPYATSLIGQGAEITLSMMMSASVIFLSTAIILHFLIILARLFLLRTRIFYTDLS